MESQKDELLKLVEKNGWKATELDNYEFHKWSMETWLLESIWSPIGTTAYVSFMIDPLSDFHNPYIWAIRVSDEKPVYGKEISYFEVSLKHWKNEKIEFLNFLQKMRNDQGQNDS